MTAVIDLPAPAQVLEFWFGDITDEAACAARNRPRWFQDGRALDAEVTRRFAPLLGAASRGELAHWAHEPAGALALVLTLDQFPRHVHRGRAEAFATDARALAVCRAGIESGLDTRLRHLERVFFYLPMEHAEDLPTQERYVSLTRALGETCTPALRPFIEDCSRAARTHRDIIARFGRFPHRNDALGRDTTAEEREFLDGGGARFGQ